MKWYEEDYQPFVMQCAATLLVNSAEREDHDLIFSACKLHGHGWKDRNLLLAAVDDMVDSDDPDTRQRLYAIYDLAQETLRNLHFYGKSLENLKWRLSEMAESFGAEVEVKVDDAVFRSVDAKNDDFEWPENIWYNSSFTC